MKRLRIWMVIPALLVGGMVGLASAKLPPLTDDQKAAAAAKKAKAGEAAKKAAEALARAQDRAVANHKSRGGAQPADAMKGPGMKGPAMMKKK